MDKVIDFLGTWTLISLAIIAVLIIGHYAIKLSRIIRRRLEK